ncbi:MAG: hypothetical protein WDA09_02970, partial [Bacteriovoracaceae bacterium]
AYYELALNQARTLKMTYPYLPGIYLNPSALFLSLEYDIPLMLSLAEKEGPSLIERNIYLCIYQDTQGEARVHELSYDELQILQILENGPAFNYQVFEDYKPELLRQLSGSEIVLDLLKN